MTRPFVVIGANLAGGRAVESLRQQGHDGPIVLVGDEPDRPYERPPLSKQILTGDMDPGAPFLRDADWYATNDIDLRLSVRCRELDPDGTVLLSTGETVAFDACILATGGRPRRLELPGSDLDGVTYLRTLRDSTDLAGRLAARPRVVVIGAGFIGAEVAASARTLGCDVTMVEMLDVPLGRVLGPQLGQVYADIHRDHGVDLRLGEGVERIEGSDRVEAVVGTSGTRYPADLVVVGVGIVPNVELASDAGLECDNGVVVDDRLRTAAPNVYAVGDVANRPGPGGGRIRVEHFQSAEGQGTHVGKILTGQDEPYAELAWFWSDQYDVNLQMLGHPSPDARRVIRGNVTDRAFTTFDIEGDRVIAAIAVNAPRDIAPTRRLIERRVAVDPDTLADPDRSLRDLLR